ncbi:MAG TPA: nuclear transport factor 2 family protein [Actinomycetes bacterium]|nr:nuclear transport factor 2 family protein [Actinomycetes bacterium]
MALTTEERVRRLEDRAAIQDLAVMYGYVMDERVVDGIARLFTNDATLRSADGVFAATGLDEIVKTYQGRFDVLGPTNHFVHGHVVQFDDGEPDVATGIVSSHAEVVRNDQPMWVALRYQDTYRRTPEGWRFADRLMSYMYYVDVREYAEVLGQELRVRTYDQPAPGDWPQSLRGESVGWGTGYLD